MAKQQTLFKGELMEELLRDYFLNLGYYVVRGVKYKYEGNDITDVDLFLYGRSSSLLRQRINVDIKNKKSPQAFERILWANGLKKLLGFNSCIVATTDSRPVIHSFGQMHNTGILDGNFLKKLGNKKIESNRITEEDLLTELAKHRSYNFYKNKDWKYIYEISKGKLLTELDYSGANSILNIIHYFLEKYLTDKQKQETAIRLVYLTLSHFLIIVDFIIKDIAFLEQEQREKKLSDGFKYGNLGKDGVDKIVSMANEIAGGKPNNSILESIDSLPIEVFRDFFGKNDNAKNLFNWATELEYIAYYNTVMKPIDLPPNLKGVLSMLLDYYKIDRKKFFEHLLN